MRVNVPARPAIGLLVFSAAVAWLAVLVVEQRAWSAYAAGERQLVCLPLLAAVGSAGGAALLASTRVRARRMSDALRLIGVLCVSFLCVGACAVLYWHSWAQDVRVLEQAAREGGLSCELVSDASTRDYGEVSVVACDVGGHGIEARLLWPQDSEPLTAGHRVQVEASLSVPENDEGGRWNHQQGYAGMLSARRVADAGYADGLQGLVAPFRDACFTRIEVLGGEAAALLSGVLVSNETLYEQSELEHDFQTTGLAHLMAVSGSHLAVVSALMGWLLSRMPLRRNVRSVLVCVCLLWYVVLTCLAPSAVRSCAMCAVALLAGSAQRRQHALSALALVVLGFIALAPNAAFSVGLQLSVLSVGGLILFAPLVRSWLAHMLPQRAEPLAELLAATFAATATTTPVTVSLFAQFSPIAPLANLLAGPLVTAMLGIGIPALLVCAAVPVAGTFMLSVAGALASLTAALVHVLADVPGACVPLDAGAGVLGPACAGMLAVLWAAWPVPPARGGMSSQLDGAGDAGDFARSQPETRGLSLGGGASRGAFALALAAPLAFVLACGFGGPSGAVHALDPRAKSGPQVVMLDVGQGDSMLVRDGDAAVLVDTGADGALLERGLARNGVTHLDAVFVTHKDDDHCGALGALAGTVGVEHVYVHEDLVDDPVMADVADGARQATAGGGLEPYGVGDAVRIGHFTMALLSPRDGGTSENGDSLVNLLEYDADGDGDAEARGLLTGDAEAEATEGVVSQVGDVEFLKVAHHGSRKAATAEELSVLKPEIALIGVGADNRYGHPTREMLDLLSGCHAKVYRTDVDGDISLAFTAAGIRVTVQKTTETTA